MVKTEMGACVQKFSSHFPGLASDSFCCSILNSIKVQLPHGSRLDVGKMAVCERTVRKIRTFHIKNPPCLVAIKKDNSIKKYHTLLTLSIIEVV